MLIYILQAQWEDLNSKQNKTKILQKAQESDDEKMEEDESPSSAAPLTSANPALPVVGESHLPSAAHEVIDEDDNIT